MNLLALDTSTEQLSVAGCAGKRLAVRDGAAGPHASAALLPAVQSVLAELGLALADLDAIAFGQGPGSFTGLRTACSVAQGLAFGAGLPVLPIPSLLALAVQARRQTDAVSPGLAPPGVVAVLDARMGEIYTARIDLSRPVRDQYEAARQAVLMQPAQLEPQPGDLVAGNAWQTGATVGHAAWGPAMQALEPGQRVHALPTATAMLDLCAPLLDAGLAVDPALALPLYVRDRVALTSAERERIKGASA